jgi:phenylacetate-coenzyme A ligase PaaK-like adenylate-forming protein
MDLSNVINISPYSLNKKDKKKLLNSFLIDLSKHHYKKSKNFKKMLDAYGYNDKDLYDYINLPFLPVRLFKMFDLKSIDQDNIVKTMTSSGTSGQSVSKIFLDKKTASNQTKVLSKIMSSFIGKKRLPMIIIDTESVLKNRNLFSARGAGILGFSIFGNKKIYALDEKMELNTDHVKNFISKYKNEKILIFGFTFMIWEYFYKKLVEKNILLDLSNSLLIHGGGWKKLINESVSNKIFKKRLRSICGIKNIHDYYGMVEQTGSIYMECEYGYLHSSIFSDIIIRNPLDFSISKSGEIGIIQLLSILPYSYPGHSILTEDEGILIGEDDCDCGRLGKYFKIIGRLKNAEIRGCSDTYED